MAPALLGAGRFAAGGCTVVASRMKLARCCASAGESGAGAATARERRRLTAVSCRLRPGRSSSCSLVSERDASLSLEGLQLQQTDCLSLCLLSSSTLLFFLFLPFLFSFSFLYFHRVGRLRLVSSAQTATSLRSSVLRLPRLLACATACQSFVRPTQTLDTRLRVTIRIQENSAPRSLAAQEARCFALLDLVPLAGVAAGDVGLDVPLHPGPVDAGAESIPRSCNAGMAG